MGDDYSPRLTIWGAEKDEYCEYGNEHLKYYGTVMYPLVDDEGLVNAIRELLAMIPADTKDEAVFIHHRGLIFGKDMLSSVIINAHCLREGTTETMVKMCLQGLYWQAEDLLHGGQDDPSTLTPE